MRHYLQVRRGTNEVLAVVQYGEAAPAEEVLAAADVELVPFPAMGDPEATAQGLARDPNGPEGKAVLDRFRAGLPALVLPRPRPPSGLSLKARVRALDARVAALEARRPASP